MSGKDTLSTADAAMLDAHVASLMECKLLPEDEVKKLCEKVRTTTLSSGDQRGLVPLAFSNGPRI